MPHFTRVTKINDHIKRNVDQNVILKGFPALNVINYYKRSFQYDLKWLRLAG